MQQERPGSHGWFEQESAGKPYPIRGIAVSPSQQLRNAGDAGDVARHRALDHPEGLADEAQGAARGRRPRGARRSRRRRPNRQAADRLLLARDLAEVNSSFYRPHQRKTWREKGTRSVKWFSRAEAARTVREPVLRDIIRKLGKRS